MFGMMCGGVCDGGECVGVDGNERERGRERDERGGRLRVVWIVLCVCVVVV